MIQMKVLFRPSDGRLLGAQAVGREGVEKRIDVLATFLQMKATVHDLEEAELCYAPQYGAAKDPVNFAGFIAVNHLRGDSPLVHWDELTEARHTDRAGGPFVLDVREPSEFAAGSVPGAVNIPLGQLRDRLGELPKDREIWAHCRSGQRSHTAVRILRQLGYEARNLSGGWLEHENDREVGGK
jgi:rhodanese-related sulfurtransferase